VDEAALLEELTATAGLLFERHLAAAREWFPHELIAPGGELPTLSLPSGVRSALVVNVLTEDALPYYAIAIHRQFGRSGVWWDWLRRWTAEEQRHASVIRGYLWTTGVVDPVELERARLTYMAAASIPDVGGTVASFVYLALQELATRVAHHNTGARLDETGRRVMQRVANDENLHHLFYRDIVNRALEIDPSTAIAAIDTQVRHFAMPGAGMPRFAEHAKAIAAAGIFGPRQLLEQVFEPLVFRVWSLQDRQGLAAEAEQARDRCLAFLSRLARIADRLAQSASDAAQAGAAAPASGW
jgi:acyl-[acyl-carrier-protein] desaturase